MTAYHSGNSVPHIHVDDQFAGFDPVDWENSDDFANQAFHNHDLSGHFYGKEQSYHQHQIAHKPLDRFVYANANEDPFSYGLHAQAQSQQAQAQVFAGAAAVPGQFDSFHLPPSINDPAWTTRLSSPVDTIFSYNSGCNNNYLPAETPSNQTFDSLRTSQSPVSDYHLHCRSPSQPYHVATSIDSFSNEDSSCITLREIQQIPDMSAFNIGSSSTAAVADTVITLPSQHHTAEVDALHEVDAEGEVDDESYRAAARAPASATEDAVESDTEPAEGHDAASKSDGSDSDYKPSRGARSARNRNTRRSSGTHRRRPSSTLAEPSANRVNKRQTPADRRPSATRSPRAPTFNRSNSGHSTSATASVDRPFSCPLMPYGCRATFASKNEWKRHFNIQHVCLGFWRCDLCPDAQTRPNDFNRKDLFKQHLRRMHRGEKGGATGGNGAAACVTSSIATSPNTPAPAADDDEAFEAALEAVRMRCWVQLRSPPARLACVFCADAPPPKRGFEGPACTEEWLEHVGRHLASAAARRDGRLTSAEGRAEMCARWESDGVLREWLIREGLVEPRGDGRFVLADRVVASEAAQRRRSSAGVASAAERDVDGKALD